MSTKNVKTTHTQMATCQQTKRETDRSGTELISEAGHHTIGFQVAWEIEIVRDLSLNCHLSVKIKPFSVKTLTQAVEINTEKKSELA